jgi:hypothetical protein
LRASSKSAVVCLLCWCNLATRINRLENVFEMQRLRTTRLACSVYTHKPIAHVNSLIH